MTGEGYVNMMLDSAAGAGGSVAAIPSPSGNVLELGPLTFNWYGIAIAVGVLVALTIARNRWAARGGDPDDISALALWAVPAGLVGARLYHLATDWHRYYGRWEEAPMMWNGGLGIPGGIVAGVLVGWWVVRRKGLPMGRLLDVVAPALPAGQAIGRLGNWFNQELFGGPTDLPWGLEIDPAHRPREYLESATFHPTFLYEALWNLGLVAILLVVERHWKARPGSLFATYVGGYAIGRFLVEAVRVDPATELLGLRINLWMSALAAVAAVVFIVVYNRGGSSGEGVSTDESGDGETLDKEHLDSVKS